MFIPGNSRFSKTYRPFWPERCVRHWGVPGEEQCGEEIYPGMEEFSICTMCCEIALRNVPRPAQGVDASSWKYTLAPIGLLQTHCRPVLGKQGHGMCICMFYLPGSSCVVFLGVVLFLLGQIHEFSACHNTESHSNLKELKCPWVESRLCDGMYLRGPLPTPEAYWGDLKEGIQGWWGAADLLPTGCLCNSRSRQWLARWM